MLDRLKGRRASLAVLLVLTCLGAVPISAQDCVPIAPAAPALRFVGPEQVRAGDQLLLQGKGFSDGPAPTVSIGGSSAPVVASRGDLGVIVVTVPALDPGVHAVSFRSGGVDSNALCVEVVVGAAPVACTLNGTARDDQGNVLPGTLIAALDPAGENFVQGAVANGFGNWSMSLPAGDYALLAMPPAVGDSPLPVGFRIAELAGFGCPGGGSVDFVFPTGLQRLDVDVVDGEGAPLPNASCDAESEELFAFGLTDAAGRCSFMLPPGTYEVFVDTAWGSRHVAPGFLGEIVLDGGADPAPIQGVAPAGVLFCGTLVAPDGRGLGDGEVEAFEIGGDFSPQGLALTASCTGDFAIALPADTRLELLLFPPEENDDPPTSVREVRIAEDTRAEFPFKIQPPGPLGLSEGAPRPGFLEGSPGAPGAPVLILGDGFVGASHEVLFPSAAGGAPIPAEDVVVDAERGVMFARVPEGAGTGGVVVRVDGVESAPVPFRLADEPFVEGPNSVGGTVTAGGVPLQGAVVVLFALPPSGCDEDDVIADYAVTDAGGSYTLSHSDTGGFLDVLPPASSDRATFSDELGAGVGNVIRDVALVTGITVTFTVSDVDTGAGVAGAQVELETDSSFDRRVTNGSGTAVLRIASGGQAEAEIVPPAGSRYREAQLEGVVGAGAVVPVDLVAQRVVSGGLRSAGGPVVGGLVEGSVQVQSGPGIFLFERLTGPDGEWCGPFFNGTEPSDRFVLSFLELGPELAPLGLAPSLSEERDFILYPSLVAEAAGRIEGTVTGAGGAGPLAGVSVQAFALLPNGDIDWDSGAVGFTRTCPSGTYSLTVAAEEHVVVANQPFGDFDAGFGEVWSPDAACSEQATPVSVAAGLAVTADLELPLVGRITGTVVSGGVTPVEGVSVEITDTNGGCVWFLQTDAAGSYAQSVPAGGGYRVRFDAFAQGFWSACFDGDQECQDPTLVTVTAGLDTANVDFDFSDDCPGDPDKTEPGACGCGVPDEDSDGDGVADCDDLCPGMPDDADGDGVLSCQGDDCDEDPLKTAPGQCGCGRTDFGDVNEDGVADELDCDCEPADLQPGGGVGLADWLVGWRVLNLGAPSNERIEECGELFPGTRTTCPERELPSWCPDGQLPPAFTADDLLVIREIAAGLLEVDCAACVDGGVSPAETGARRLAGDVAGAPDGGPDDVVNVADVLRVLRWAVGLDLELLTPELQMRADVAPLEPDGSVGGDGSLDVSDVLSVLRRAVGLVELPWPSRSIRVDSSLEGVAARHRVSGWPVWAEFDGVTGCGGGGSGVDVLDEVWVATCATDPTLAPADVTIGYRAPEAVVLEGLQGLTTVVDAALVESQAVPTITEDE